MDGIVWRMELLFYVGLATLNWQKNLYKIYK